MDGSRGATGAVDVGVSHLNMNINVIGGGHGLGGGDKSTAGGDSSSSSPPVGEQCSRQRGAVLQQHLERLVISLLSPGFSRISLIKKAHCSLVCFFLLL